MIYCILNSVSQFRIYNHRHSDKNGKCHTLVSLSSSVWSHICILPIFLRHYSSTFNCAYWWRVPWSLHVEQSRLLLQAVHPCAAKLQPASPSSAALMVKRISIYLDSRYRKNTLNLHNNIFASIWLLCSKYPPLSLSSLQPDGGTAVCNEITALDISSYLYPWYSTIVRLVLCVLLPF